MRPAARLGRGVHKSVHAVRPQASLDIPQHFHGQWLAAIWTGWGLARPDEKASSGSSLPTHCQNFSQNALSTSTWHVKIWNTTSKHDSKLAATDKAAFCRLRQSARRMIGTEMRLNGCHCHHRVVSHQTRRGIGRQDGEDSPRQPNTQFASKPNPPNPPAHVRCIGQHKGI